MIKDRLEYQKNVVRFIIEHNVKTMIEVYEKFPEIYSLMHNKNFRVMVRILLKENRQRRLCEK